MVKQLKQEETGIVFNIQHYCIHDGPGIRSNIFLKGCPLRCLWCQNPESNLLQPQIMYDHSQCVGCMACINQCPNQAISFEKGKVKTDRDLCTGCGACVPHCLAEARTLIGEWKTVDEVYEEVAKDQLFYASSGGGITLTGGELLFQPTFSKNILKKCKDNGLHTAIETCGFAKWDVLKGILEYVDLVLYDLKHMNSQEHRKCTGVGNELILENLYRISTELKLPIIVRTPIIPDYNDSDENMRLMGAFLSEKIPTCTEVNLLPYHNMGEGKKDQLEKGLSAFTSHTPSVNELEHLLSILMSYGLKAK
jgi:pyruvate formate lyase activating enzyme